MKKVLTGFLFICTISFSLSAQQVARARYVQLVTTSSPVDSLQLTLKGGISFIGSASFTQHGKIVLLSNPVAGTSDWLDSTTGVLSASSLGMVSFRGITNLQNISGPTTFYGLTINGTGINLNQSNEVKNQLNLTNGLIYITNRDDSIYVSNPLLTSVNYTIDPFATTSWVHGKLSRRLTATSPAYEFPVGKIKNGDSLYAPVTLLKQNTNTSIYSVQYFPDLPVNRTSINPFFHHISDLEFWEITSHGFATLPDNYAKLSLSWRTYSDVSPSPTNWDSLVIAHYVDPGDAVFIWEPENVNPLATVQPGSTINFGYFTNEKYIGDYSMPHLNFTIGTRTISNALPANLLDYRVTLNNNRTVLNNWITTNDVLVEKYEVERTANATSNTWSALGTVTSARAAGNSNYNYTDMHPLTGWNYYRLKIFENNTTRYSATRAVYLGEKNLLTLFPNPAQDHIYVSLPSFDSKALLQLADNSGRILSTIMPQSSTVRLSLTKLAAGVYHIRYVSQGNVYSKSFIHNN